MSRYLRYLRIAFSATCLIACVLLIVLWVRSYWRNDIIGYRGPSITTSAASEFGSLSFSRIYQTGESVWFTYLEPVDRDESDYSPIALLFMFGYVHRAPNNSLGIYFPHWAPALLAAILAGIPWATVLRRFSLRTLLIATTIIAVVLGLIVWASR